MVPVLVNTTGWGKTNTAKTLQANRLTWITILDFFVSVGFNKKKKEKLNNGGLKNYS
jgi:hypothetical protein